MVGQPQPGAGRRYPETAFTNRRLTHQLPPSPPEVVAASVDKEEHADEDDATDND